MIKINGEMSDSDGMVLSQLLLSKGYDTKRIAVELNEEIVPKAQYDSVILKDGDSLEVVTFVGGG